MTWRVVYDDATGGDVAAGGKRSVGTVVTDPLAPGMLSKVIAGPPQQQQWNTTTREWEPKPPPPPDVDRVDEVIAAVEAVQPMSTRVKNALRPELEKVLGDQRFHHPDDPYEIRGRS